MLDEQSGNIKGFNRPNLRNTKYKNDFIDSDYKEIDFGKVNMYDDEGGASRFFYTAKSSSGERNYGCEELESRRGGSMEANTTDTMQLGGASLKGEYKEIKHTKNVHPTVKPISLMEYLIKLVTPKGAIVLDPFLGSGTTAIACLNINRKFIGIEKEEEYIKIAEKRIKFWEKPKERRAVQIETHKIIEQAKQNKQQKTLW